VELCDIPKVGGKTARMLYEVHGIDGLQALQQALDDGTLDGVKGMGKKTLETMRKHIEKVEAERSGEKSPGR
jgi:DNA polymerase/3'-5' exonuclease PolX